MSSTVEEQRLTTEVAPQTSRMSSSSSDQRNSPSTDERNSQGSSGSKSPVSASVLPVTELFPLEGLLEELLHQEAELWCRNELLMQSLRPVNGGPGSSAELEVTDVVSTGSTLNSISGSQLPEDGHAEIDKRLYLIKYGKLSNTIHKYFRRLERRHACLYLTATRAKRETLRHVERLDDTSEGPPDLATGAVPAENGRQLITLRDDEAHVYRRALMCAQFPMLSAPEPPDGGSPTPPPPALPLRFTDVIGSVPSAARTVPDEFLTSIPPDIITGKSTVNSTTALPNGHLQQGQQAHQRLQNGLGPSEPGPSQEHSPGRQRKHTRPSRKLSRNSSTGSKDSRDTVETVDSPNRVNGTTEKLNPSDPIPIRTGSKKYSRRKRDSHSLTNGDSSQLAKLPAVDSDEEDELIQLTSNKNLVDPTSTDHLGREQPFSPMVNREMLGNLVRRAFHQTEEQQTNFEQMLKLENGRRSKGEILAKELASQLQVLENNAHPFYKPKLFVTRNGYDLWLQAEKHRVRSMIDKFWHFSLPRPQLWRHYNPTDYHKAYGILLQKVIGCESRTDRREPVHSGKTPSSPLSPTSLRLLTEFGLRYGVGELYRKIVYLDYLAKHFDYEIWYIKHCTEELRGIRELLPRSRNKITAVRKEMEMLRATVHLLHGQTDNSLTRIDRLFMDSDPKEGVASLIELLAELLDAEQSLFGKKVRSVEVWLKRYLKSGFVLRYERRKEIAADETIQSRTAHPFVLTPTLINSLLLDTRDEVYDYKEKFQTVFRPYFDIVPFAKEEFYRLLCADACTLCSNMIHRQESRQSVSLEMLGLMYRLNERDLEWENVIPTESQLWRQKFVDLALIWMEVFGKQVNKWVVTAVAQDQWMMLSLVNPPFTSHESTDGPDCLLSSPRRSLSAGAYRHSPKFIANASVRLSPFPSPIGADSRSAISPGVRVLGGAFTPYKRPILKRPLKSPIPSESSGAVTDTSSPCADSSTTSVDRSTCGSSIAGEVSDIFFKGTMTKKHNDKKDQADSLLNFSQSVPESQPFEFDANGECAGNEIEVSVSVYDGYDPTDDVNHNQDDAADETLRLESPDSQPHSTVANSSAGQHHHDHCSANWEPPVATDTTAAPQGDPQVTAWPSSTENKTTTDGGLAVLPKLAVVRTAAREKKQKKRQRHSCGGNSDYVSSTDSFRLKLGSHNNTSEPVVKFGNMLDHCYSEGSDAEGANTVKKSTIVKPTVVRPSGLTTQVTADVFDKKGDRNGTATDEFHIPPASVGTVPELADWRKDHPYGSFAANGSSSGSNIGSSSHASFDESQDTLKESSDGEASLEPRSSASCAGGSHQTFLFPVSNSPMDIVTMLMRLASFTGTILGVLIPKVKSNTFNASKSMGEYAPDVAAAREQANQQLRFAESTRRELLKKLHRTILSSLRLYADNLLCMDLCGWSGAEAIKLLGEEKVYGLKRRKDVGEIWGCRHMIEARHGFHPHGIPCQKRTASKEFKSITRDMCVRINNIHTLIVMFESLEEQLYSCLRTALPKPISAFGYVSSDPGELSPRPMTDKPTQSSLLHPCSDRATMSEVLPSMKDLRKGHLPGSLPLMESAQNGGLIPEEERKPDVGFKSKESDQLLQYLKTAQRAQFRLICIRMNNFFKPALSLLMDLKLRDCSIEKRLRPLFTFLTRHRSALQKYIYKDCFNIIMEYLWEYILRDLEDEAVKLRTHKHPVTDRAQMLNQTLSHLIQFMYNRGEGLPLDHLTSSSEFLQGLLDIMTRSTDQLMAIFSTLSSPQFTRIHFDLSKAPVPIDARVLHTLRVQLHAIKKCFSGKEFVDKVLEIGRGYGLLLENQSDTDSPDSLRRSSASLGGSQLFTTTEQPIEYTVRYACDVGQFLLKERMLIQLPKSSREESQALTPQQSLEGSHHHRQLTGTFDHPNVSYDSSSYSHDYSPGMNRINVGSRGAGASSADSIGQGTRRDAYRYRYSSHSSAGQRRIPAPEFMNSPTTFYKFADSEDKEQSSLYQSHILVSSSHVVSQPAGTAVSTAQALSSPLHRTSMNRTESTTQDHTELLNARRETLFLVYDLLVQRSRKEKRAKHFLQTPPAMEIQSQKRANSHTSCDLIIKM